ncbi:MAG: sulfite exporter TauE/SafE family protein [Planctomycetota bacterium]
MWPLIAAVAGASLIGSVHCAGMCGPFAVLVGRGERRALPLDLRYHAGRLLSYVLLGTLAGGLGAALDLTGRALGAQRVALVLAGAGLIAFGLLGLARQCGLPLPSPRRDGPLRRVAVRLQGLAIGLDPRRRAWAVGAASGLLPCGWLYAYVLTAAATGSSAYGAAVMAVFWLGTVPALALVAASARSLLGPLESRAPAIGSIALVLLGLVALGGRFRVPALNGAQAPEDRAAALLSVEGLDHTEASCCSTPEEGDGTDGRD